MLFGLDGVEIGLIIVFVCLFGGILSGFPVAFAIGGAGIISFGIIAGLTTIPTSTSRCPINPVTGARTVALASIERRSWTVARASSTRASAWPAPARIASSCASKVSSSS